VFRTIPLTLTVGGENIIDDENFDQKDFLKKVAACPECPKSACPSPERYMKAYERQWYGFNPAVIFPFI